VQLVITPEMLEVSEPIKSVGKHSMKVVMAPDMVGEFMVTVEKA